MSHQPKVYVDFDGTISPDHFPAPLTKPPNDNCIALLNELRFRGYLIVISSVRANRELWRSEGTPPSRIEEKIGEMMGYLAEHGVPYDEIDERKPLYELSLDDRAIRVTQGNWLAVGAQALGMLPSVGPGFPDGRD